MLFSLVFLPGVLLHETSHYITARLLGVRTGRFSVLPRSLPNGRLQLGFVETSATDWLRDGLIGAAPLVWGGLFVAYAGLNHLGLASVLATLEQNGLAAALTSFLGLNTRPDFWLWFYLVFAVSSTMMPSTSDRRSWLPLVISAVLLLALSLLVGAGPWLALHVSAPFNRMVRSLALVLGISVGIHMILLPPLWGVRHLAGRITGLRVA